MSAILIFLAVLACIIGWWMTRQRLTAKPWLETGRAGEIQTTQGSPLPTAKIGLGIFLAVVGALFTLFISAYLTRSAEADWWSIPIPRLLWVNTAILVASSAALEWAKAEAHRGRSETVRTALAVAFVTAVLIILIWAATGPLFPFPSRHKVPLDRAKLRTAQGRSQNGFNDLWANSGDAGTPSMIVNLESR